MECFANRTPLSFDVLTFLPRTSTTICITTKFIPFALFVYFVFCASFRSIPNGGYFIIISYEQTSVCDAGLAIPLSLSSMNRCLCKFECHSAQLFQFPFVILRSCDTRMHRCAPSACNENAMDNA